LWPPPWLGTLYAKLYTHFGPDAFTTREVLPFLKSGAAARVAIHRLRKAGCLFLHGERGGRGLYRLAAPEPYLLAVAGRLQGLDRVPQQRYCRLLGLFCAELLWQRLPVRSVVLFGSVARGRAKADSDIDLLVVLEGFRSLGEALDRLVEVEFSPRVAAEIEWLEAHGVATHLSFHPLTPQELHQHPPILLDILDEGIVLMDDGTFTQVAEGLRDRLAGLGARRVWLSEDEWVWVLKPDARFGEVIEL
jgi:predicted nucleotidyltransferase